MSKKILVADDHAVVRTGLVSIIRKYTPHTVIAEVGDGLKTVEQARRHKPDLILLDIGMPGLNGLETAVQIQEILPHSKILVLSIHRDRRFVISALRHGASGYLLKEGAVGELVTAIRRVLEGKRYISPVLSDIVADELVAPKRKRLTSQIEELTARERQVLSQIAVGASRGEIASRLHISPETVKTHRKNIMLKLHLHNHSDLVKFALEHGLGPLPQ